MSIRRRSAKAAVPPKPTGDFTPTYTDAEAKVLARPKALKIDTRPLEKEVEGKVCKYATSLGFYVRKFVSPAHRSVPDRYLIAPGRPGATPQDLAATLGDRLLKVEFKRPGEKATENQLREHEVLRGYGVAVYVIDNVADGKKLVDRYREWWMM